MPSYSSYMRQMSVLDKDDDITWITVKGNHIPIKKGQSKGDAVKEFFESKKSGEKKTITKSTSKNLKRSWKSEGSGKAKYKVGQKVSVGGKEYEVSAVKSANLSKEPYYKLSNGEWRHENEIKESNGVKREAAKIYSKLADKMGYVEKADLEKYLDDNEYFNDDVRKEIVKTVGELESQASERHTEKDAPKPVHQWQNPQPRGKYVEGEVERIVESQKKESVGMSQKKLEERIKIAKSKIDTFSNSNKKRLTDKDTSKEIVAYHKKELKELERQLAKLMGENK